MNTFQIDTTEALRLEIWQLENEANVKAEAQEKARKEQERLIEQGLLGESVAADKIITKATTRVTEALNEYIEQTLTPQRGKPSKSIPACKVLKKFTEKELRNIVGDSIAMCLNGVGITPENTLIHQIGEHIEHTFQLREFHRQDKKAAEFLREQLKKRNGNTKQNYKALEYSLSANRLEWKPWKNHQVVLVGQIVFQLIINSSELFDLQPVVEVF